MSLYCIWSYWYWTALELSTTASGPAALHHHRHHHHHYPDQSQLQAEGRFLRWHFDPTFCPCWCCSSHVLARATANLHTILTNPTLLEGSSFLILSVQTHFRILTSPQQLSTPNRFKLVAPKSFPHKILRFWCLCLWNFASVSLTLPTLTFLVVKFKVLPFEGHLGYDCNQKSWRTVTFSFWVNYFRACVSYRFRAVFHGQFVKLLLLHSHCVTLSSPSPLTCFLIQLHLRPICLSVVPLDLGLFLNWRTEFDHRGAS